jgi:hypothetical protein
MAELKTRPTGKSVAAFLNGIKDDERRADCKKIAQLLRRVTRSQPRMWGPSIVGFGTFTYRNSTGKDNEWFLAGFSPRKAAITLYLYGLYAGYDGRDTLLKKLGKHKRGGGCLYIKRLADVDVDVLRRLAAASIADTRSRFD